MTHGVLSGNPARAVKGLKEGRTQGRRGRSLSADEFKKFVVTIERMAGEGAFSRYCAVAACRCFRTGMRKGELLAPRWTDLYVDGELRVERAVWQRQEKTTKTDDPRRIVVVEPLAEVLSEQRRWLFSTQHPGFSSGLIFPANLRQAKAGARRRGSDKLSWYRSTSIFHKPLAKVVAEAGITEISQHSLRRTWENLLREANVDVLVRRALAGWRTEKAQAIYATVDKKEREAAGEAVVRLVFGGGS